MIRSMRPPNAAWESGPYHLSARSLSLAATSLGDIRLLEIDAGGRLLPHAHKVASFYLGLSGEGQLSLEGTTHPFRPDEHWVIPANTLCALTNPGDGPLRLLVVPMVQPTDEEAQSLLTRWRRRLPTR